MVDKKWYAGWLYCNRNEIEHLKELGVIGPMVWEKLSFEGLAESSIKFLKALEKDGAISRCLCDEETMNRLVDEYGEWWKTHYLYYDEKYLDYPYNHFSLFSLEQAKDEWNWTLQDD